MEIKAHFKDAEVVVVCEIINPLQTRKFPDKFYKSFVVLTALLSVRKFLQVFLEIYEASASEYLESLKKCLLQLRKNDIITMSISVQMVSLVSDN